MKELKITRERAIKRLEWILKYETYCSDKLSCAAINMAITVLRRIAPENKPLTLEQLKQMDTPYALWKEELPSGDMMVSSIEPVLFNGVCCGKEERACWVTSNAHRANARTEYIIAGKINFYIRKPEEIKP